MIGEILAMIKRRKPMKTQCSLNLISNPGKKIKKAPKNINLNLARSLRLISFKT
jgi:hypothetical protein